MRLLCKDHVTVADTLVNELETFLATEKPMATCVYLRRVSAIVSDADDRTICAVHVQQHAVRHLGANARQDNRRVFFAHSRCLVTAAIECTQV